MAFVQELTQQVVALTTEVGALTSRLVLAEQTQSKKGITSGVFDQNKLYSKDLKEGSSFRAWSSRFIAWLRMDNADSTSRL